MENKKETYIALNANMFEFNTWIQTCDPEKLKSDFNELLKVAGFTVVNFTEHFFPVKGYTAVWLLAESHLAIHTFPDQDKTYVQISSCNKEKLHVFVSKL